MTIEQLKTLPFEFKSHIAMEGYHTSRYTYKCEQYTIILDVVTKRKNYYSLGKSHSEYMLISDGEIVYEGRSRDELVYAITEVEKLKVSDN